MCGIVALFSKREPISGEALQRATRTLHHRGPDGQRQWIAPHGRVGLGHARLSIIDLVTGDQPIANENEQLHLVVNGEFYGYEAIRNELIARGHAMRTHSDSEIALHLYEELGTSCLKRLRGEFALVLWDEANQVLFAARDRFGVKPLYWTRVGETLALASEAKALFAAGVPARWDHESFFQIMHVYFDQDRSLFEGVYQVPPGCYLLATRQQVQIVRYWDFDYPRADQTPSHISDDEYIERMRTALDESVRIRLRADVPVGCYLSGGIDSCAILGIASQHHPDPIEAFTLCFDTAAYNEEAVASEMAARAGANFHPLPVTQAILADNFADAVWHSETLTANAHGVAKYLLSERVRDFGYKVVLTGEGSDEILGGYAHFRRDLLLYNSGDQDPRTVEQLLARLHDENEVSRGVLLPSGASLSLDSVQRRLGYVPSWLETRSANSTRYRRLFRSDFLQQFEHRDPFQVFLDRFDIEGQLAGRDPVNQSLYLWTKSMLPNYLLNMLGDRMEMAHSIEGRVPFLDHHVVELVKSLPVSLKIRGMTEKFILREAARHVLTPTVYGRQKHPFLAPPSGLDASGRLNQLMGDVFASRVLDDQPFFDPQGVRGLLQKMPSLEESKRSGASYILTMVLSACVLHERYRL
jgi:asparagine synthase (glutamine-hydrolysing)